jgi:hypothetical protein
MQHKSLIRNVPNQIKIHENACIKKNTWKMCALEKEREILKIYKPTLAAVLTYNAHPTFYLPALQ